MMIRLKIWKEKFKKYTILFYLSTEKSILMLQMRIWPSKEIEKNLLKTFRRVMFSKEDIHWLSIRMKEDN